CTTDSDSVLFACPPRWRIVERTAFATAAPYKTPLELSSPVTRLDTRYAYFDCTLGPIAE
ncbi:hypothetical protein PISMIDRAFT_690944, partial [Pisolithus microcarpus 441]